MIIENRREWLVALDDWRYWNADTRKWGPPSEATRYEPWEAERLASRRVGARAVSRNEVIAMLFAKASDVWWERMLRRGLRLRNAVLRRLASWG